MYTNSRRTFGGRARVYLAVFVCALLAGLMAAPSSFAQASLYWDWSESQGLCNFSGEWCVAPRHYVALAFRLSNQTGQSVSGFTNGLVMYVADADGGLGAGNSNVDMSATFEPVWWDSSYVGWSYEWHDPPGEWLPTSPDYYSGVGAVFVVQQFGVDGSGADTIGIGTAAGETTTGFPAGWDEVLIRLRTGLDTDLNDLYLCVDSCYYPPAGTWLWDPQGPPQWDGPYCFRVVPCGMCPFYVSYPTDTSTEHCQPASTEVAALYESPEGIPQEVLFAITGCTGQGQAHLESVGFDDCVVVYDPVPEDVGSAVCVTIAAETPSSNCWPTYADWNVTVLDQCTPVQLVGGGEKYVVQTGEPLTVTPEVVDPYELPTHVFGYYAEPECADPPCSFDSETGALTYEGAAADTGVYCVNVTVEEGIFADTTSYCIYHFDTYICGNINHRGSIDISDLVWLVDFMFKEGVPPVTYLAGDLDCNGVVEITDLVYLVNYMFKEGPEPCAGCP